MNVDALLNLSFQLTSRIGLITRFSIHHDTVFILLKTSRPYHNESREGGVLSPVKKLCVVFNFNLEKLFQLVKYFLVFLFITNQLLDILYMIH